MQAKLKKRIETLTKNFQTKIEVQKTIDQTIEETKEHNREKEEQQKLRYLQIVIGKTQNIRNKLAVQEEIKNSNKEVYAKKLILSDLKSKEAEQKIMQFEAIERELVDKLKETSSKHRVALGHLQKVVTDGHKYYEQSYTEKKALLDERKLSLPSISRPS
jgi:RNase adaptor protein for sRNA GlmZ degradation